MKKIIILFAAACLLAACDKDKEADYIAQYFFGGSDANITPDNPDGGGYSGIVPNGLIAFYPLDGDTSDESGNALNGDVAGDVGVSSGHNASSRCAYFPGMRGSYIYVPYSKKLQMNEWTVNLWFYYEKAKKNTGSLLSMGRDKTPGSFLIGMNVVYFINSKGVSQYGTLYEDESQLPSASTWHMITVQVKDTDVALYFDGKLVWNDNLDEKYINNVTDDLYIGVAKWNGSYDFPFEGRIDDVRIYNRILSAEEVSTLYND